LGGDGGGGQLKWLKKKKVSGEGLEVPFSHRGKGKSKYLQASYPNLTGSLHGGGVL
jgi:hypothetical protein